MASCLKTSKRRQPGLLGRLESQKWILQDKLFLDLYQNPCFQSIPCCWFRSQITLTLTVCSVLGKLKPGPLTCYTSTLPLNYPISPSLSLTSQFSFGLRKQKKNSMLLKAQFQSALALSSRLRKGNGYYFTEFSFHKSCITVCLVCLTWGTETVWDLIYRSALCARKRELLSSARRISALEISICLVAKKGVAFRNFLESTSE